MKAYQGGKDWLFPQLRKPIKQMETPVSGGGKLLRNMLELFSKRYWENQCTFTGPKRPYSTYHIQCYLHKPHSLLIEININLALGLTAFCVYMYICVCVCAYTHTYTYKHMYVYVIFTDVYIYYYILYKYNFSLYTHKCLFSPQGQLTSANLLSHF